MTESRLDALERLCRDNLQGAEFQVTMTEDRTRKRWGGSVEAVQAETVVMVDYVGPPDDVQEVAEQHGEVMVSEYQSRDGQFGEVETSADLLLTADPHEDWTGSGATGGSSGGSSSPATTGSSETDADSEPASQEQEGGVTGQGPHQPFPDPSMSLAWVDGTMHVVSSEDTDDGGTQFVCDEDVREAEPAGNIKNQYDDLIGAAADPDLCEWCAKALIGYYNLPEEKVLEREKADG